MKTSSNTASSSVRDRLRRDTTLRGLVDSNILIYAHDQKSKLHIPAKTWLEDTALKGQLFIAWQNLLEFYSIVTSSKRTRNPLTPADAKKIINEYLKSFAVIYPNRKSQEFFITMLGRRKISGPTIYDVYLASTALGNRVKTIYTANTKDFANTPGIKAVNPLVS